MADECAPAYEEHRLGLRVTAGERTSQNGVVLETARAFYACDGDYVVPFVPMRPFIDASMLADYDRFAAEAKRLARNASPAPSPR